MTRTGDVLDCFAECRRVLAVHSKSFALAGRLLPRPQRDRLAAIYAWCREADDAIDLAPATSAPSGAPANGGADALVRLRAELRSIYGGESQTRPSAIAFQHVVRACGIPIGLPAALLDGLAMDVDGTRYETLADLRRYAFRVAGTVGVMACRVFGVRSRQVLVHGAHLGIAMQLTNVCRDVVEDWERGRLYVPAELLPWVVRNELALARGGALPASAQAPLAAAVRRLLAESERFYRSADRGIRALDPRTRLAVRTARLVYAAIGDALAARGGAVEGPRAVVPLRRKLVLVARAIGAERRAAVERAARRPPRDARPARPADVHAVGEAPPTDAAGSRCPAFAADDTLAPRPELSTNDGAAERPLRSPDDAAAARRPALASMVLAARAAGGVLAVAGMLATLLARPCGAAGVQPPLTPGTYRLEMRYVSRARLPMVGESSSTYRSLSLVRIEIDGDRLVQSHRVCTAEIEGSIPLVGLVMPPSFIAALGSHTYAIDVAGDADGWRYHADLGVEYVGYRPDGTDALPRAADDPAVFDWDRDGKPGGTIKLSVPVAPDGELYVVQRGHALLDGRLTARDRVEGTIAIPLFEQAVIGAWPSFLQRTPEIVADTTGSRFTLVRLMDESGCDAVVAMRGAS